MPQKREYKDNVGKAVVGGSVGGLSLLLRQDPKFKDNFINKINRADFVADPANNIFSSFSEVDPRLTQGFINYGTDGVKAVAPSVWKNTLASEYTPWERADITGAGDYEKALNKSKFKNITTVTPDASSARFGGTAASPVGGAVSETLWGNPKTPRFSYASGNTSGLGYVMNGVGELNNKNPSAHFSGVELPQSEQTDYLYTGGSQEVTSDKRGWGVSKHNNPKADFNAGSDVHFGREHRKVAGLTTANDLYTYIQDQGYQPPKPTSNPGQYLKELTDTVRRITDDSLSDNDILIQQASLQPTSGPTLRNTGNLPIQSKLDWKGSSIKAIRKAGDETFFQRLNLKEKANLDPFDMSWVPAPIDTNVEMKIDPRIAKAGSQDYVPSGRNLGKNLASRFGPGAIATSIVSPEVANDIRKGDYLSAGGKAAGAFGIGELIAGGTNLLLDKASSVAPFLPSAVSNLSTIAAPAAVGISSIDAFSTLASGKNARELAVETGNVGPALQAMSMPRTMAPLGGAGAVSQSVGMQATVPNLYPERKKESEAGDKRVKAARKRGGRFRFAGLSLPEFGFSEGLGIN
jgi:hypothetical protein